MKFNKYGVSMLLLCVLLASKVEQTLSNSDLGQEITLGSIPLTNKLIAMTVPRPLARILVTSLGVIQLAADILKGRATSGGKLSKNYFLEKHSEIMDSIKNVNDQVSDATEKLGYLIESYGLMEEMRNTLDTLRESYADNMKVILNPTIKGVPKDTSMTAMLDYFSTFRQSLRSFVTKFIKPKGIVAASGEVNLFYDFILRKDRIAADNGDDCHLESTHTKIFKSFLYILKILTDAHVMAISAHTMQYQKELMEFNDDEALETQQISLKLLNQYKLDMKAFMEKTKWALDKSSREIRNCGTLDLIRGETFDSLSFARILPKLRDWNYDHSAHYSRITGPDFKCYTREQDVKFSDYEIDDNCTNGDLKTPSRVKVFVNSSNTEWPYTYLMNVPRFGEDQTIGHKRTEPGLVKREFFAIQLCYPVFCPAFKKNAAGISTQIVRAQSGNVITGLRFRVRKNILYVDIQEGKFLDDLQVDSETLTWTETPESDEVLYMNANARKIELGSAELNDEYLTTIQLKFKNEDEGIIGFYVGGNSTTSGLNGSSDLSKSNELLLSGSDNPEQYGADVKNMISKAPLPSKPYHVSFQASDLKKDFGTTTLPLIDIREVVSDPPGPIGGFGIYHQTVKGSGGYLSLKLIASNLSRFIDYNVIEETIDNTQKG